MTSDPHRRGRVGACLLAGLALGSLSAGAAVPAAAQPQDAMARRLLGLVNA